MSRLPTIECPPPEVLLAYLREDAEGMAHLDDHVQHCLICQERLSEACDGRTISQWRQLDQRISESSRDPIENARTTVALREHDTDAEPRPREPLGSAGPPPIAGYLDLEEVARGGMGVVYRARDRKLKRWVALKVLPRDSAIHPDRWLRFQTEAEAAARLQHDNVIRVYDADSHKGIAYVSQELADPRSLADRIEQTPQNARYTAELVRQLAKGMQHAHDHGVLHRDLKPSNVLFVGDVPKIADFGIAKLLDAPNQLTQTQAIIGTPDYMAPEQATAETEKIGFATDVYAMGVILYEMLTGVRPFRGETSLEIIRQVVETDPLSPRKLIASIPKDLETICLKCLIKRPEGRYATASALEEDLGRYLNGQPVRAKPVGIAEHSWKWIRRHPAWSSLAAVVCLSIISLMVVWAKFTHALSVQTTIAEESAREAENRLAAQIESNEATKEVVEFLTVDLFDAAIPENEGIGLTVLDVLDSAGESIDRRFGDQPRIEAALRAAIGNTYHETGHREQALEHLERAVAIYDDLGDQGDVELSQDARLSLALCVKSLGQPERSRELLTQLLEENTSDELRLTARYVLLNARDGIEPLLPDDSEMLQLHDECVRVLGATHTKTLSVLGTIAVAHFRVGDFEEAAEIFREQREALIGAVGNIHPDTVIATNNLAISYIRLNRYDDAEALHRENCDYKLECLGPEHYMTMKAYHHLAMVVWRQGKREEATEILEKVIRDRMRVLGPENLSSLDSLFQIGRMYQEMGRHDLGAEVFYQVIEPVWDQRQDTPRWLDLAQVFGAMLHHAGDEDRASELRDVASEMLKFDELANDYRLGVQQAFESLFDDSL